VRRMTVSALDVATASETLLDRVYEIMARCHAGASSAEPYRSRSEAEAFLRHPPELETREYWIAEREGRCVGFAQLAVAPGSPTSRGEVLVHPANRRTGVGTALLEAVCSQTSALGAQLLIGRHSTEAGAFFAAAVGAVDAERNVRSLLELPLAEELELRPVRGYKLRSWVGPAPAALLDSFAHAREAINDAPDEEVAVWDGARVRDLEAALERRDRDIRVTVALDERGAVVAFTELRVSRAKGAIANTEDTAVVREHRRRGLGFWVKLESLRRLEQERPDVAVVTTTNAEQNDAMLALNRALGFSAVAVHTNCVLWV
jgi:mycothiol synthase